MSAPRIGIFLSAEEHGPRDLVRFGAAAAEHRFTDISVSDHFHPWVDEQGHSPFVWGVLGGLAAVAPDARLGTGVTCPTIRIHPAIVAQAAATAASMAGGGFFLGVGTGENLNEHVLGDRWPPTDVRLEMLEEAVDVMRALWTGDEVARSGRHYTVENARIYDLPAEPPPVVVSAFGPKAAKVAARIGDGMATTSPDAEVISTFRDEGGTGPVIAFTKACWGPDEQGCRELAFRLWPNGGLPGELAQELKTPLTSSRRSSSSTRRPPSARCRADPTPRSTSRPCARTSRPAATRSTSTRSATPRRRCSPSTATR